MKKKVKKYAEGGATGAVPPLSMMPAYPRSNMGLTGIRDAASDLIGTAGQVSQMSQSLVGGGGGMGGGFGDDYGGERSFQTPDALMSNLKQLGVGFKKGGKVSSASKRGDGIAQRGRTKGRMV
jgi:hypothetical protein